MDQEERNQSKKTALLFVSELSIYFQATLSEFKKIITELQSNQPFETRIIDVEKEPEMAEKYKIDALPTLVIGEKRFVGRPKADIILNLIRKNQKK
jgi:protein-disulfide isomerase